MSVPTKEEVKSANKLLKNMAKDLEIQKKITELKQLDDIQPNVDKLKNLEQNASSVRVKILNRCCKRPPPEATQGIVIVPGGKVKKQRYRLKDGKEEVSKTQLETRKKEIDTELQQKKDIIDLKLAETDDLELKIWFAELVELETEHEGETKELAEKIQKMGINVKPNIAAIADERSKLVLEKDSLEKKHQEVVKEAEEKWRKEVKQEIKTDRSMVHFVIDVLGMRNWMIDGSSNLSAREQMHKLEYQQKIGRSEFAFVENLIVFSTNQEQVVHCKKTNGKWDFATYYEQCGLEYAQQEFAKCQGRTVSALPAAPGATKYETSEL
jgi:hypothetical protein